MNRIYKVIWSKVKNCYVVTSELAKSHTKGCSGKRVGRLLVAGAVAAGLMLPMGEVEAISTSYVSSYNSQYGSSSPADYQTDGCHVDFGQIGGYDQKTGSYYNYVYTNNLKIISKLNLKYKLKKISLIKENNKIKRNIK